MLVRCEMSLIDLKQETPIGKMPLERGFSRVTWATVTIRDNLGFV